MLSYNSPSVIYMKDDRSVEPFNVTGRIQSNVPIRYAEVYPSHPPLKQKNNTTIIIK